MLIDDDSNAVVAPSELAQARRTPSTIVKLLFYAAVTLLIGTCILLLMRFRLTLWKQQWASGAKLGDELSVVYEYELVDGDAMRTDLQVQVETRTINLKGIHSIAALRKALRTQGSQLVGRDVSTRWRWHTSTTWTRQCLLTSEPS